ncbi:MAG: hypothetical protein RBG13Loki_0311 [Promethearchaeota archaeon CR_4]|nr:MAG: hypothetical protein RBG13Loki_0311 [Candidatus Lokiarchaeota archaeon CR_4]
MSSPPPESSRQHCMVIKCLQCWSYVVVFGSARGEHTCTVCGLVFRANFGDSEPKWSEIREVRRPALIFGVPRGLKTAAAMRESGLPQHTGSPRRGKQHWYPLANDPALHAAGVEIGARMLLLSGESPQLRISFRANGKIASVKCVHVAVYAGPLASLPAEADLARSSEQHPISLAPEEHFFALKSYVAGIADVGIGAMFRMAREAGNQSVGFNDLMQQQILQTLFRVASRAALDLSLWLIDDATLPAAQSPHRPASIPQITSVLARWLSHAPHVSPEVLAHLALVDDFRVREAVLNHGAASDETRASLGEDGDQHVRATVAKHLFTPVETLARLAQDVNEDVRANIAENIVTPPEILARLSYDPEGLVRGRAAKHSRLPPQHLPRLAEDAHFYVRTGVAENVQSSPELLARLARDEITDVRDAVARNDHTPPKVLARLARDEYKYVRVNVARNPHTPPEILARLAEDAEVEVREGVAGNLHTPRNIFTLLVKEEAARRERYQKLVARWENDINAKEYWIEKE